MQDLIKSFFLFFFNPKNIKKKKKKTQQIWSFILAFYKVDKAWDSKLWNGFKVTNS
jgi:hypothetical protein